MILYYLDASAWIKRYCAEEGTTNVARLFDAGPAIACSALGLVEVLSTLARKGNAAATLGFNVMNSVQSLRIEGKNRPGVAAELTEKLAAAGISLRGLSAAVIGSRFIVYIGFDASQDATKAAKVLQQG